MRIKICENCGRQFEATKERSLCPECAQKAKGATVILDRVCRQCGAIFPGGPRAWYCPSCRKERLRVQARDRRAAGASKRPLGSIDHCLICGAEYVVQGARQKYCKNCAAEAIRANIIAHKKEYAQERRAKNIARKSKPAKVCIVCGKPFVSQDVSVTCSEECATIRRKQRQAAADAKRRGHKQ